MVAFRIPSLKEFFLAKLDERDIGFRQKVSLFYELDRPRKRNSRPRLLIVGSSQAGSLFREYAPERDAIQVLFLPRLQGMDLYFYEKHVVERRAERVLFYGSEIDFSFPLRWRALKIAPSQGHRLPEILFPLLSQANTPAQKREFAEFLAAQFLPEYRYGFAFRALRDRTYKAANPDREDALHPHSPYEQQVQVLGSALEYDAESLAFQVPFFEGFAEAVRASGSELFIVESDYRLAGKVVLPPEFRDTTATLFRRLADRDSGIHWAPRGSIRNLSAGDFIDGIHFRRDVAIPFAEEILAAERSLPEPTSSSR